jgi:UTP--glucose-1-phosphate uridylyltransferase
LNKQIRKAVIPAAGFGTRFLPASKSVPKELFPLLDKPVLQHIVEEAAASGIEELLIVISESKRLVKDHFGQSANLSEHLKIKNQSARLEQLESLTANIKIHFANQAQQNGLGDAVLQAKSFVASGAFAVLLGDAVTVSTQPVLAQLIDVHSRFNSMVIGTETVAAEKISQYGSIEADHVSDNIFRMTAAIEKPPVGSTNSTMAIAGRYILPFDIFAELENTPSDGSAEIQLTDAINRLLSRQAGYALRYRGLRCDIGNPRDYLRATLLMALNHPSYRDDILEIVNTQGDN